MALPLLFAGLVLVRLPEPHTVPRRVARLFVVVLMLALAVSQILEGVDAFGSEKGAVGKMVEALHRLGEAGTLFSILTLPLSFVIVGLVYTFAAVRALMRRSVYRKST